MVFSAFVAVLLFAFTVMSFRVTRFIAIHPALNFDPGNKDRQEFSEIGPEDCPGCHGIYISRRVPVLKNRTNQS
jgi:hypothetical protein